MSTQNLSTSRSGMKHYISTNNPFEREFRYHRAVRRGPLISVSGTTALRLEHELDDDTGAKVHYPEDARKQAAIAMRICIDAVKGLGGRLEDIVRVRMFVARSDCCAAVGAAFRECFASANDSLEDYMVDDVGAVATMIVVHQGFVDPDILVEVEVDAHVL